MKKVLIFGVFLGVFAFASADAAVRDGASSSIRTKSGINTQARISTTVVRSSAVDAQTRGTSTRVAATGGRTVSDTVGRAGALRTNNLRIGGTRTLGETRDSTVRSGVRGATVARAAVGDGINDTRTGAAYNQCKTAYFQCMDQFCQLKNDDYRRCSCNDRVIELANLRKNLTETNEKLTEFTENLDMVGMTAAQAKALHTASDGENALTADTSASKALLTAIMNSIRGNDATVAGKMSDLNSINLTFDTTNAFGVTDAASAVASYNGLELYNAVYPACRAAVMNDCTDATLQRAVNAYLMAVEQDCNTVQTAIVNKQKELKAAIREGGAMLDLARVENRKKHNSDNLATCIANVESAVLSEQVCGANYHKCLDNGEFIDISTGAPIKGVVRFYELGNLLKFEYGKDAADQKLAQNPNNKKFVKNFETKTRKFAADALDNCVEIADTVWAEYLDKALLDIYYAQQSKVETIKNGCFDFISQCYNDKETAITAAMSSLLDGTSALALQPDKIVLTKQMCSDYIDSCNNMFRDSGAGDIVAEYMQMQADKDTLVACRAIVQQCFDDFGGTNYENFYYPSSGLFEVGKVDTNVNYVSGNIVWPVKTALDWFTLYRYDDNGEILVDSMGKPVYVSECAKRIAAIDSCASQIEAAFGGLDSVIAKQETAEYGQYNYTKPDENGNKNILAYGWAQSGDLIDWDDPNYKFKNRRLRPTGVATEVYNQIIDSLTTQCMNVGGRFVESQFLDHNRYGVDSDDTLCVYKDSGSTYPFVQYGINAVNNAENMCPAYYNLDVDIRAWGICSCWENGGRRSKDGQISKCFAGIPVDTEAKDEACDSSSMTVGYSNNNNFWCTSNVNTSTNQVCPFNHQNDCDTDKIPSDLPDGVK